MGESIDKLIPKNQKKAQAGQDWLQELNAGQPQQGVLQQMQPLLNQLLGHHGGKSTRLNMDGTLKDMNAPSGLDWLEAHGPDRANVQARYERLGQELRPDGGLPWMAQQGAQAVEAQKQLQQMLPQAQHSVTQQWGGDDVGAVSTAMKDGLPVGFSTNTPQAKALHQFSPHDFVAMLGQLPKAAPAAQGSVPQAGDAQLPVNSFVGQTSNSPDTFSNRDRAGVRAREQERQRHNVYKDQVQPNFMDYLGAIGGFMPQQAESVAPEPQGMSWWDQLGSQLSPALESVQHAGSSALDWLGSLPQKARGLYDSAGSILPSWMYDAGAELAGMIPEVGAVPTQDIRAALPTGADTFIPPSNEAELSKFLENALRVVPGGNFIGTSGIVPQTVSRVNRAHSVGEAIGLPWLTPAEGQQLKQKLNEQATYRFPW